ncbi:hypothetical protein GQ53DRAFT_184308 [Thozetella sp. PMI_491]|nr:hypothetical protein GQ53DRAFT_184308 [Thozetella sp. PMI_491]
MSPPEYEIDPDGDVVLVLRSPNTPFAVYDTGEDPPLVMAKSSRKAKKKAKKEAKKHATLFNWLDPEPAPVVEPVPVIEPEPVEPEPVAEPEPTPEPGPALTDEPPSTVELLFEDGHHPSNTPVVPDKNTYTEVIPTEQGEVGIRLSSKHLTLASPVFKKMLQGPWSESAASSHTLHASEWDVEALLILMNILHSRVRSVPRTISLEMLAKIAVLVDYYKCHEALELFVDLWIQNLSRNLPTEYGRDLVLWLAVSWVFSKQALFTTITKVAIMESKSPLKTLDLPIPQRIVAYVDQQRQEALEEIISGLHGLLVQFYMRTECSFACSSILSGSLARQMHANRILHPKPIRPFAGESIAGMSAIVRVFHSPTWRASDSYYEHKCDLATFIEPTVNSVVDSIVGLKLKTFQL